MPIDRKSKTIPIKREAELLRIAQSTVYYQPIVDSYNLELMHLVDEEYSKTPFYGSRRMREALKRKGCRANRKRVQRLTRLMGIETIYPKKNLSRPPPGHKIYRYLF